ncbi:glycosyltransferase family A protein [Nocardioides sp.]|uniref:glycosyltransferase family 2 protein n=1 Tax=Nocardioides sp. TaxID=35761 RepID=UPI002734DED1|nr:glycosyltransferase family A protein [Nocardioides sp.]MDP3891797.1 glycosyltransferase family A protein [Nocardioides sp.]
MTNLPRVDVVIATRNRPELLAGAVDAVIGQSYPGHLHLIIVFDQSTPDHRFASTGDRRTVEVIGNHRSPGLAGARNSGIDTGSGELVAFCDDDDVWLPEKVELQVASMLSGSALTCVSGITVEYGDRSVDRVPGADELNLRNLARNRVMAAHPSTVMVQRAALATIGLVDEEIPGSYGEDFDWILRAAAAGEICVIEQPLVRVRWGQSQFSREWQTIVDAIDYGLAKHPVFHEDAKALGRLYGRRAFALAALHSRGALAAALRTMRVAPREKRAYLAAAVALHLVSAEWLMDLAHRRGHGI